MARAKSPSDRAQQPGAPAGSDAPVRLTDPRAIRALAHPARLAVLDALNRRATLTATEAADIAGLSPSAMSYHLRALAKWGIVREAASSDGVDGRERRWERAGSGLTFDPPAHGADAATAVIATHYLDQTRAQLAHWMELQHRESAFWRENSVMAYRETWLTEQEAIEARRIADTIIGESTRSDRSRPDGARRVRLSFLMFPIDDPDQPEQ